MSVRVKDLPVNTVYKLHSKFACECLYKRGKPVKDGISVEVLESCDIHRAQETQEGRVGIKFVCPPDASTRHGALEIAVMRIEKDS